MIENLVKELNAAVARWRAAADGDSGDAEHDAGFDLAETVERLTKAFNPIDWKSCPREQLQRRRQTVEHTDASRKSIVASTGISMTAAFPPNTPTVSIWTTRGQAVTMSRPEWIEFRERVDEQFDVLEALCIPEVKS